MPGGAADQDGRIQIGKDSKLPKYFILKMYFCMCYIITVYVYVFCEHLSSPYDDDSF